jgi:tetratricopeptide (TPR) repeat protein
MLFCLAGGLHAQDDLALKSQQAKRAMDAGRFAEAAAIYGELVRALPANPGLHLNLGLALYSEGKYRDALSQFQAAASREPDSAAWLMTGLSYLKLNQPRSAVAPLERALRIEPDNQRAQLELADAYLSLGKPEEAALMYKKLSASDPANAKAWQGLGLSYAALSQLAFHRLEKADPESPYRDALLGQSLLSRGQYRSAFYWYRHAMAKDPHLPGGHAALAEVYRGSGHPDWASIEEGRQRMEPKPDCQRETPECDFLTEQFSGVLALTGREHSPVAYFWQARAYEELSLQAFRHLTALPSSPEVHELMAQADLDNHNYQQAVKDWNEALKLAPRDNHLKQGLAHALWLDNSFKEAEPLLSELAQANPDAAELQFELGDTLQAMGYLDQAIPWLEKAVRLDPHLAPAQASLGRAYLRVHRAEEAIPHLKAAVPSDDTGNTLYQLAQAYKQTGQLALADEAMRRLQATTGAALARTQKMDEEHDITAP